MKKLLISILTIGVVSAVAVGVTRAFFSSQDEVLGVESEPQLIGSYEVECISL